AQRSEITLDAGGRPIVLRRQIAVPGAGARDFAARYAPRVYVQQVLHYDEANRPTLMTTGAETAELRPFGVGSWIETKYSPRGTVGAVTSSYGNLILRQQFDALGALRQRVLGDAAETTASIEYSDGHLLTGLEISRRPGPWLPQGPGYFPPNATDS